MMIEYERIVAMVHAARLQSATKRNKQHNTNLTVLLVLFLIALSSRYYHVNCDQSSSHNNQTTIATTIQSRQSVYNVQLSSPPSLFPSPEEKQETTEATINKSIAEAENNNNSPLLGSLTTTTNRYDQQPTSNSSNSGLSNLGSRYAIVGTDKNDNDDDNFTKSVSVQLGPNRMPTSTRQDMRPVVNNGTANATTTTTTSTTILFTRSISAKPAPEDHKNRQQQQQQQQQLSNTRNKRNSPVYLTLDKLDLDMDQTIQRDKQARYLMQLRQYPSIRKMSGNRNKSKITTSSTTTTSTTSTTTTTTTLMPTTTTQLGNNNSQEYEYEEYDETSNDTISSPASDSQPVGTELLQEQDTKGASNNQNQASVTSNRQQANKDNNNNNNDNNNNVATANNNNNNNNNRSKTQLWKQKFASDKSKLSISTQSKDNQQQQQQRLANNETVAIEGTSSNISSNYASDTIKKKKKARLVQLPFIKAKNESICIAPAYLEFPNDIIGDKWRSRGLIIIHMAVVVYMFYALALVCERYFMPSLEEFSQRLNLSDDVAGATLMSAGSSAPELFTAILGVFIAKGDVGTGAIVGSAVFNILFVIGICSFVTTTATHLNWWPVLRDSVFYTFTVLVLILFIYDERVSAYESLAMLALYGVYITIMIHNEQIKQYVTKFLLNTPLTSKLISAGSVDGADDVFSFNISLMGNKTANNANCVDQNNNNYNNGNTIQQTANKQLQQQQIDPIMMDDHMFRAALLMIIKHKRLFSCKLRFRAAIQFVIWQRQYKEVKRKRHQRHLQQQQSIEASYIGPEGEDEERERVIRGGANSYGLKQLHKTAQQLAQQQQLNNNTGVGSGSVTTTYNNYGTGQQNIIGGSSIGQNQQTAAMQQQQSISSGQQQRIARYATQSTVSKSKFSLVAEEDLEMWHNPPAQDRSRFDYYVWLAKIPCNFVLYHTIPDCTLYPDKYWLTFIISITWTAIFSYVMVWMVTLIGFTLGIPDSIMGITFLAAGTSVPDAYSSIHVARMGMADMAVSNSIGSNIFDILIGLSLPWFIQTAIYPGVVATINSRGVIYSVILLFMSLVATIYLFNRYNWTLQPRLGLALLMTYCLFLVLTCMLEFNMFGHVNPPPCL